MWRRIKEKKNYFLLSRRETKEEERWKRGNGNGNVLERECERAIDYENEQEREDEQDRERVYELLEMSRSTILSLVVEFVQVFQ